MSIGIAYISHWHFRLLRNDAASISSEVSRLPCTEAARRDKTLARSFTQGLGAGTPPASVFILDVGCISERKLAAKWRALRDSNSRPSDS